MPMVADAQPFEIAVEEEALEDLRRRLARTRWPRPVPGSEGWGLGTQTDTLRRLVARWEDGFDWRRQESALNRLPHFSVTLDKTRIHFLRWQGEGDDRLPIVLTHGWPGSFLELIELAERLSAPARHGLDARRAFDVVVPSLPGFGFSEQRPVAVDPWDTSRLWHALMTDVLGYARYAAHGGDLGAGVTSRLAALFPDQVVGVHLLAAAPPEQPDPAGLTDAERAYVDEVERWQQQEGAYMHQQQTRPLSLAYGLSDSPAGMLAWMTEKLRGWSDSAGDLSRRFSDDHVLTWASLYWLTNTMATSFRPYSEFFAAPSPVGVIDARAALALFPADLTHPPEEWVRRTYPGLERYTRMPRGGHFAAFEEPDLLAQDILAFFA